MSNPSLPERLDTQAALLTVVPRAITEPLRGDNRGAPDSTGYNILPPPAADDEHPCPNASPKKTSD